MIIGKRHYLLETGGHCFLCLKSGSGSPSGQNVSKVTSLRNMIRQYLKLDLGEALWQSVSLSADIMSMLGLGDSDELLGPLCPSCTQLSESFSAHFLEMEVIRMKLKFCLKAIYDRMAGVDDNGNEEFKREMSKRPETLDQLGIVERLRKKTLERCSIMLAAASPRVKIERLSDAVPQMATGNKLGDRSAPDEELNPSNFVNSDIAAENGGRKDENQIGGHDHLPIPLPSQPKHLVKLGNHGRQCQLCGKMFTQKAHLIVHLKTVHLQIREHLCDLCGNRFTQKVHLAKHRRSVHFARIMKVPEEISLDLDSESQQAYSGEVDVKPLIQMGPCKKRHPGPGRRLKCKQCPRLFTSYQGRNIHMGTCLAAVRRHSLQSLPKRKVPKKDVISPSTTKVVQVESEQHCSFNKDTDLYKCSLCEAEFRRKSIFIGHFNRTHRKDDSTSDASPDHPARSKKSPVRKLQHVTPESGKRQRAPKSCVKLSYRCHVSSKRFTAETSLKGHFKVAHLKPRNDSYCGPCDKKFSSAWSLQTHINTYHLELRQFECQFCGNRFKQKAHLQRHIGFLHKSSENLKAPTTTSPKSKSKSKLGISSQKSTTQNEAEVSSPDLGVAIGNVEVPPTIDVTQPLYSDHAPLANYAFQKNELPNMGLIAGTPDADTGHESIDINNPFEPSTSGDPKQEGLSFPNGLLDMDLD